MGAVHCCKCLDGCGDYGNPLLTIHHVGKWNNKIMCLRCLLAQFDNKFNITQLNLDVYR